MTLKQLMLSMIMVGIVLALVLWSGVPNEITEALLMFIAWLCFLFPIGVWAGNIIHGMAIADRDNDHS